MLLQHIIKYEEQLGVLPTFLAVSYSASIALFN